MSADNTPTEALACIEQQIVRAVAEGIHSYPSSAFHLRPLQSFYQWCPRLLRECRTNRTSCLPSWVNVSYVCGHWRNIALNCPTLWSYHFNLSLRWTEELLLRSKQASLEISYPDQRSEKGCWWSPHEHRWLGPVDTFLKHSECLQKLRLFLPPELIPAELSLCTPRLEILEIHLSHQPKSSVMITVGDTSVLRKLKLIRCPLLWYSLDLRRLNTLHLYCAPVQLNMAEFLALLGAMQDLSILQLKHALPSPHGFLAGGPKINLPRLAFLANVAPLSRVDALLSCIIIPLKTRLNLELLSEGHSSVRDYTPISSFLAQFSVSQQQSLSGPIFRSLIINAGLFPGLTISSSERDYDPSSPTEEWGHNIPLKITLEERRRVVEAEENICISNICCSLPLTNIHSLCIIHPCQFSADLLVWREILGHLDGLRHMKLSHGWMPDLSVLFLAAHEPVENLSGQPTCDQDPTCTGGIGAPLQQVYI